VAPQALSAGAVDIGCPLTRAFGYAKSFQTTPAFQNATSRRTLRAVGITAQKFKSKAIGAGTVGAAQPLNSLKECLVMNLIATAGAVSKPIRLPSTIQLENLADWKEAICWRIECARIRLNFGLPENDFFLENEVRDFVAECHRLKGGEL
jgi:hypothetical protein